MRNRSGEAVKAVPKRKKVIRCNRCPTIVHDNAFDWIIYYGERLCYPCCVAADKAKKDAITDKANAIATAKAKTKENAAKKLST